MTHATPNILLHPGGGGAQYPFRFKPFRPRNLWRRTPGPRPPGKGSNGLRTLIGLLVVVTVAAVIAVAVSTDFFGLTDSTDPDVEYVDAATEVGFQIESNIIERRIRRLNGEFNGVAAVIVIPRNSETLRAGDSQVSFAARWLQVGTNWQALQVHRAIVVCEPKPQCSELANSLTTAVSES